MRKYTFLFLVTFLFACQSEKSTTPNNATNSTSVSNPTPTNTPNPINTTTEATKNATQEPTSKPTQIPAVLPMPNGTKKVIPEQQRLSSAQKQIPKTEVLKPQTTKTEVVTTQQQTTKTPPIVAQYYMAVGEKAPNPQKIACYTQAAAKFGLEFIATRKSLPQHQKANNEATQLMIKRWGNDWNRQFEEAVSNCLVASERK